ncbi:Uncharacterised protein [Mycobacterium tuberculosis]|nr:Uncharacterised protein [Mycobacterium tuberculosis]
MQTEHFLHKIRSFSFYIARVANNLSRIRIYCQLISSWTTASTGTSSTSLASLRSFYLRRFSLFSIWFCSFNFLFRFSFSLNIWDTLCFGFFSLFGFTFSCTFIPLFRTLQLV